MGWFDALRAAFLPERTAEADHLPRQLLREISQMPRLTGILPYLAWQEDARLFVLDQGGFGEREEHAIGFCIETLPQTGASDEMEKVLASLFVSCPPGTGIQISLYGSPHILPLLRAQANLLPSSASIDEADSDERRHGNIFRLLARRRIDHYLRALASPSSATRPICCGIFVRSSRLPCLSIPNRRQMSTRHYASEKAFTRRSSLLICRDTIGVPAIS